MLRQKDHWCTATQNYRVRPCLGIEGREKGQASFEDLKHEEATPEYALCCSCMLASFPTHVLHMFGTRLPWDGFTPVYKSLCCVSGACLCPYAFTHGHSALFTASCFHPPGPIMMSLRPGSELLDSQTLPPERPLSNSMVQVSPQPLEPMKQPAEDGDQAPFSLLEEKLAKWTAEHHLGEKSCLTNGFDVFECSPPKTENELLQMFYRQQEEIRRLRELLIQREVQTKQLELEIKNLRMALGQL